MSKKVYTVRKNLKSWGYMMGVLLFQTLLFFSSCRQDSIFYDISIEPPPKDPKISGSSSNIVEFSGKIYATNRGGKSIYRYAASNWETIPVMDNCIVWELAATQRYLYVISSSGYNTARFQVCRMDAAGQWELLAPEEGDAAEYANVQTIYGAGNTLFIGAKRGDARNYAVLSVGDGETALKLRKTGGEQSLGILSGAAWDGSSWYLAISGETNMNRGIFRIGGTGDGGEPLPTVNPDQPTSKLNVVGVIAVNGGVAAVARADGSGRGRILIKTGGDFNVYERSEKFTGALGIWKKAGEEDSLLLLGVQGTGTSDHGYREIFLAGGRLPEALSDGQTSFIWSPGDSGGRPSSVTDKNNEANNKYKASLGKKPVNSIFQVPVAIEDPGAEGEAVIFASTPVDGLWSYRNEQWNAEP